MQEFEQKLLERGYKKSSVFLVSKEDYDVYRAIRDKEGEVIYQIFYRFWDWTKYNPPKLTEEYEASIDLVIMPCFDGRADLTISSCDSNAHLDIDKMEKLAEEYYQFIIERLK